MKDFRRKILKLFASAYTHNQNLSWMKDKKWKLLVQMTYIYFNTILHMSWCYCPVYTWIARFPLLGSENLKVFSLGKICRRSLQSLQSTMLTITHKHNLNFLVYWIMFHPYWFTVIMCNNSMLIYVTTAFDVHTANFHFVYMTVQVLTLLVYCMFAELKILFPLHWNHIYHFLIEILP